MSDKHYFEWRVKNSNRDYPLKQNDQLRKDLILDACIFLKPPITLIKVVVSEFFVELHTETDRGIIIWKNNKTGPVDFVYNDFGKIIMGHDAITDMARLPVGHTEIYNLEFLETISYDDISLTLMGQAGSLELVAGESSRVERTEQELTIELDPNTGEFEFEGISRINDQLIIDGNLQLTGDSCNQIIMNKGKAVINDICLPPCFDCNERLTVGDVHQKMVELENRTTSLEST